MSRKLPALTAKKLVRFLKRQGFLEDDQDGSHLSLVHQVTKKTTTVPVHTGVDIGKGLLKKILTQAGFTSDDFYRLR